MIFTVGKINVVYPKLVYLKHILTRSLPLIVSRSRREELERIQLITEIITQVKKHFGISDFLTMSRSSLRAKSKIAVIFGLSDLIVEIHWPILEYFFFTYVHFTLLLLTTPRSQVKKNTKKQNKYTFNTYHVITNFL